MSRVNCSLLAGIVLFLPTVLLAADPPAGTYKMVLPLQGNRPLWLLKFESKEEKWTAEATPAPEVIPGKIEGLKVEKGTLTFALNLGKGSFEFEAKVPAEKGAKIYGTVSMKGDVNPVVLEPTTLTSLEPFDLSRELLAKSTDNIEITQAAIVCLQNAESKMAKSDEAKVWAEKAVKAAEPYGPKWRRTIVMQIAETLGEQKGFNGLALEYAREAEKALDPVNDNPRLQKKVLTLLADALDQAGMKEDAKKIRERNDKIASVVAKPFAGRKGKSDRVVLVEFFSCAQQPTCVAQDLAAAALMSTYKPSEVVLLQYHLNFPGQDALSCKDAEFRAIFYETQRATPALCFNGTKTQPGAGGTDSSQAVYDQFTDVLAELLEKPAKVKVTAAATRKGNTIEIKADGMADLPEKDFPDLHLRIALVEEEVAYTGANKVSKYVQVVRSFPGGTVGKVLTKKEKSASVTASVDLDELKKTLKAYHDKLAGAAPKKDIPLELKKLRVVVFVQNDESLEILNAVQVDVK